VLIEVIDDVAEVRARLADGGRVERHFVRMDLDLTRSLVRAPVPPGFAIAPATLDRVRSYARVVCAAYTAGHPDHQPEDDDPIAAAAMIASCMAGTDSGPWIAEASLHATGPDGGLAALVMVTEGSSGGGAPRPWISELAVDPWWAGRGVGPALVMASAERLVERGETVVGLAVTVGNPARLLYERLGFTLVHEVWRISTKDA
jgi:ribosomal protein S18 acetylase RimI-like enzyme